MIIPEQHLSVKLKAINLTFPNANDEDILEFIRLNRGFTTKADGDKIESIINVYETSTGLSLAPLLMAYKYGLICPLFERTEDDLVESMFEFIAEYTIEKLPIAEQTVYVIPFYETVENGVEVHVKWFSNVLQSGDTFLFNKEGVERVND